jgi:regulator of protease activity HflC (stomatin/prohibitin superfamily)
VQMIEDRLLRFDLDNIRVQVSGGKFYEVDAFLAYRIADPRKFRETVSGSRERWPSSGCRRVSTRRCAGSTVCAASRRRCRKNVPR